MTIGLIDSGIGGYSILHLAQKMLPQHEYVYLADKEHFPYSERSEENLIALAKMHVRTLIENNNCKIIILACNTLSVAALSAVRESFPDTKFVGTVPPVKVAAESLGSDANILVLATQRTAGSQYLRQLLETASGPNWEVVGSTDLVKAIEAKDAVETKNVLAAIKTTHSEQKYSGIVLGCTHFPLASDEIQKTWPNAKLFSPSEGVIKQLKKLLALERANGK